MNRMNQIVLEGVLIVNFDEILISTEDGSIAVELPACVPAQDGKECRIVGRLIMSDKKIKVEHIDYRVDYRG